MKKITYFLLFPLIILTGCTVAHHPNHPDYSIQKPQVRYQPNKENLSHMVKQLQGSPYVWAEEGPNQFDCSGFTYYLYGSMGIDIPRVARNQAKVGKRVAPKDLQYGDLIFFATNNRNKRKITHVGMYLGNGWFTHASTVKNEVIYSNFFKSPYYKKRMRVCRRYLPDEIRQEPILATNTPVWKTEEVVKSISSPSESTKPLEVKTEIKETTIATSEKKTKKAIVIQAPLEDIESSHTEGSFYVQVGSFVGHPKQSLLSKIKNLGLHYQILKFPKNKKQISKLLIGAYKTRAQANLVLPKVQRNIRKDAFIAEIR